ncbi:hypothetical protein BJX66DRAFT_307493 [Aspergillus keveii]|uniref:Uncharacterized protein n=1 Tax=Aspergillus keveii TaxID=714993 RepID=A0ABR4G0N5_9EURO
MKSLAWFADWSFGPTGLSNLSAIAYGDFSHGERFKWSQVRLCRRSLLMTDELGTSSQAWSYRIASPSEFQHALDGIDGANEMLSACQTENIQTPWQAGEEWKKFLADYTK